MDLDDVGMLAGRQEFREFLRWLLALSGVMTPSGYGEGALMYYRAGRRDLGLEVLNLVRAAGVSVDSLLDAGDDRESVDE